MRISTICIVLMIGVVPVSGQICGDCDGSGTVTILDALRAGQHGAGLIAIVTPSFELCNVTGVPGGPATGVVDVLDALTLAQEAAGLMPVLVCAVAPDCTMTTPAPVAPTRDLLVSWSAIEIFSSPVDISIEFSTDGGATWSPTAPGLGGDGSMALAAAPAPGVAHVYSWNTLIDGVGIGAPQAAELRITVSLPSSMGMCASASFLVDNQPPQSTPVWGLIVAPGPPSRTEHSLVYDSVRQRVLLYGGSALGSDVWALDVATDTWSLLVPTGALPPVRRAHVAVYDAPRDSMIIFGGFLAGSVRANDTWQLDFTTGLDGVWTQLLTASSPSPRAWHCGDYDPTPGFEQMVVFGGHDGAESNETWVLDLAPGGPGTWTLLMPAGTPPSARHFTSCVIDPVRRRLIDTWGWDSGMVQSSDVFALTLTPGTETWTQLAPGGTIPPRRLNAILVRDSLRNRLVAFSGQFAAGANYLTDSWELDLSTPDGVWTEILPGGTIPAGRRDHRAVYDPVRDRVLFYGGSPGGAELWQLAF